MNTGSDKNTTKVVCMIENSELAEFLNHSFKLMQQHPQGKRYYHTLTPEDNSPVAIHDNTNQITYIVTGSGTAYLNGVEQKVKAGNIFLIEAGTTMRFIANSEGLTLFHIHVPDSGREEDRRILEGEDFKHYEIK